MREMLDLLETFMDFTGRIVEQILDTVILIFLFTICVGFWGAAGWFAWKGLQWLMS